jgi:hypothetical protein
MAGNQNLERVSWSFSPIVSVLRIRFSVALDLAVKLLQFERRTDFRRPSPPFLVA